MTYKVIDRLLDREGFISNIYLDSVGMPTIGYGCAIYTTQEKKAINFTNEELALIASDNKSNNGKNMTVDQVRAIFQNSDNDFTSGDSSVAVRDFSGVKRKASNKIYITQETGLILMIYKLVKIELDVLREFPWLATRTQNLIDAFILAVYQLGMGGWKKFKNTIAGVENYDYQTVYMSLTAAASNKEYVEQNKGWINQTPKRVVDFLADFAYDIKYMHRKIMGINTNIQYADSMGVNAKQTDMSKTGNIINSIKFLKHTPFDRVKV